MILMCFEFRTTTSYMYYNGNFNPARLTYSVRKRSLYYKLCIYHERKR